MSFPSPLRDGESILVKGSADEPYTITNDAGKYTCTCPAFRYHQSCKHVISLFIERGVPEPEELVDTSPRAEVSSKTEVAAPAAPRRPVSRTARAPGIHPAPPDSPDGLPELWIALDSKKPAKYRNGDVANVTGVFVRVRYVD